MVGAKEIRVGDQTKTGLEHPDEASTYCVIVTLIEIAAKVLDVLRLMQYKWKISALTAKNDGGASTNS